MCPLHHSVLRVERINIALHCQKNIRQPLAEARLQRQDAVEAGPGHDAAGLTNRTRCEAGSNVMTRSFRNR